MRVELKSVKHFPSMSEETECFQAVVYIDGKRAGAAENRGQGGPTSFMFESRELRESFEKYALGLPERTVVLPGGETFTYKMSGEALIDHLLIEYVRSVDARRSARRLERKGEANAREGFPYSVEISTATEMIILGMKAESDLANAIEYVKRKFGWTEIKSTEIYKSKGAR